MTAVNEFGILACPFCGSLECTPNSNYTYVWVDCDDCKSQGPRVRANWDLNKRQADYDSAIELWNKRPTLENTDG